MSHNNLSFSDVPIYMSDRQLANLQTFLCVAHHLSFAKAADKLHITPSAVSHRISNLEEYLGFPLFHRYARRIQSTAEGERLFDILDESFKKIGTEIHNIKSNNLSGSVNILVQTSICNEWLIPKIADFTDNHPLIQLNITTTDQIAPLQDRIIDLALYYSDGYFPRCNSIQLMAETIYPVCTKEYAEKYQLFNHPENLSHCTLLYDTQSWENTINNTEWGLWLERNSIAPFSIQKSMIMNNSSTAIRAAVANAGIAIGHHHLVKQLLEYGQLISPFMQYSPLQTIFNYYLVWSSSQKPSMRLTIFLEWIKKQAHISRSSY